MANTKVEILVKAPAGLDLYLVGNVTALGEWNPSKAVKLEYCDVCGNYKVSKLLPVDENIEFKVLAAKSWDAVEKDGYNNDVPNHTFVATKGSKVEVEAKF